MTIPANYSRLFAAVAFIIVTGIVAAGMVPAAQAGSMGRGAAQRNGAAVQSPAARDIDLVKRCQSQPEMAGTKACKYAIARHPEMVGAAPGGATAP